MGGRRSTSAIDPYATGVAVVIPTRNGGARFREVLEALAIQDVEGGVELVVIDSASTDGTAAAAEAAGARVERIDPRDFDHGTTRNRGISLTCAPIVALLTQDALPMGPSYLRHLAAPFSSSRVDGVYARQFPRPDCDPLLAERLRRWSASRTAPELQVLVPGDPVRSRALFSALPPIERYLCCAFDDVASAIRRSTWKRIPLPARRFGEDVAWAREVLLAGGSVAFEPAACVEHSHRIRLRREFQRIYADHRNLYELFGLRNVPSWAAVWAGGKLQCGVYRDLLASQRLPGRERLGWRAYSIPYAFLETAAQFLGARSLWKAEESRFWRWFDSRMRGERPRRAMPPPSSKGG
ncbi:MAG: glycosyltransferase family 2 protein [Planctomycetota bacterium]